MVGSLVVWCGGVDDGELLSVFNDCGPLRVAVLVEVGVQIGEVCECGRVGGWWVRVSPRLLWFGSPWLRLPCRLW